jgi:hypothetical protein
MSSAFLQVDGAGDGAADLIADLAAPVQVVKLGALRVGELGAQRPRVAGSVVGVVEQRADRSSRSSNSCR